MAAYGSLVAGQSPSTGVGCADYRLYINSVCETKAPLHLRRYLRDICLYL